jgi:transposase
MWRIIMHIASVGIDLGKTTFHLVALGERSKVLIRKKFSRAQLLACTANLPPSLIGLEACSGAEAVTKQNMRFVPIKTEE